METGRPSRDFGVTTESTAVSPIGPAGEPLEMSPRERPIELQRAGISFSCKTPGGCGGVASSSLRRTATQFGGLGFNW